MCSMDAVDATDGGVEYLRKPCARSRRLQADLDAANEAIANHVKENQKLRRQLASPESPLLSQPPIGTDS